MQRQNMAISLSPQVIQYAKADNTTSCKLELQEDIYYKLIFLHVLLLLVSHLTAQIHQSR